MTDDHQTPSCDQSDIVARLDELDGRLTDLEAAVQALRGYVGGRRGAVASVGRRADAALAAVDRIERDRQERTTKHDRQERTTEHNRQERTTEHDRQDTGDTDSPDDHPDSTGGGKR